LGFCTVQSVTDRTAQLVTDPTVGLGGLEPPYSHGSHWI
jgi:hypothetical protein